MVYLYCPKCNFKVKKPVDKCPNCKYTTSEYISDFKKWKNDI